MKTPSRQAEGFGRLLDSNPRAVLIYGTDAREVGGRTRALIRSVVGEPADPFRFMEYQSSRIVEEPWRLLEEISVCSPPGGKRVVHVRDADDSLTSAIGEVLNARSAEALVVVDAGDLSPRSTLLRLFETGGFAAAIACGRDKPHSLRQRVKQEFEEHGLRISGDAIDFLVNNLGTESFITSYEIEKLLLFAASEDRVIDVEDVIACMADSSSFELRDVARALARRDIIAFDRSLARAYQEGATPVAVLRTASRYIQTLHLGASRRSGPPNWSDEELAFTINWLVSDEIKHKTHGDRHVSPFHSLLRDLGDMRKHAKSSPRR